VATGGRRMRSRKKVFERRGALVRRDIYFSFG
jgi:hypothetical protein